MSVGFVAYVKRWMHDGKGLLASKSVSVLHCSPHGLCWYLIQTVLVMLELKWGQQKKNYHYCPQNSIVDGVLTSQMLRINLLWRYFRLPGACIKFLINHTKTWYSFFTSYEGKNPEVPPGKYFYMAAYFTVCIFLFNSESRMFLLTISNSCILSLLDVFTSPLDLILMVN